MGTRTAEENVFPGACEQTPSKAMFFDWINHAWEGANEKCTQANLEFFKWLHDEYGMVLDIFLFDAGTIDGLQTYGSVSSEAFRRRLPNGLKPLCEKAKAIGCRPGMWLGPDGYGTTPSEEKARREMLVSLARDFNMALFKFDGCCGNLRDDRSGSFARTMAEVRRYCPDLVALNHRINLDKKAVRHMTTWLWQGAETYIDTHMPNTACGIHHRVGAMSRGLPPGLSRLTEDHGVCLSSCLDYWEDDLVLQAFNRCLIMAPEIYGNPWFLRDDEFPRLARIFNLHRRYRDILVDGITLPAAYGANAVARGDKATRFVTLANLSWTPRSYYVRLDGEIGLEKCGRVEVRQFHPTEKVIGVFRYGSRIRVAVQPFRSCLLMAASGPVAEIGVAGCDYEVVRDVPGKPVKLKLLGMPGTKASISIVRGRLPVVAGAVLDGRSRPDLAGGRTVQISFPGKPFKAAVHRRLARLVRIAVPEDAEALYEATCFASDNNALEVRSIARSGPTKIAQVRKARAAFFSQKRFRDLGIHDRNLFDGSRKTFFHCQDDAGPIRGGALRVDFGKAVRMDRLVITLADADWPQAAMGPCSVSADLLTWVPVGIEYKGRIATVELPRGLRARYLRLGGYHGKIGDVRGEWKGRRLDRSLWRASLVFGLYGKAPARRAWCASFRLAGIPANSYLAVAIHGRHGHECAYAALRTGGRPVGSPDRSVSYRSSYWECRVRDSDANTTYYFPLTPEMSGKRISAIVLQLADAPAGRIRPEVWITAYPAPFLAKELVLHRS